MKNKKTQTLSRNMFENMIKKALQNTIENAYRDQYAKLEAMRKRMNDNEFAVFLEKERAGLLSNEGFERFDWLKQRLGISTYDTLSFMCGHTITEKTKEPVDWAECWRNSTWREEDFVKEYFLGVALEGKLWAVTQFQEGEKQKEDILNLHSLNDRLENNEGTIKKDVKKDLPALEDAIKQPGKVLSKTQPHLFEKLFIDEKSMKCALDAATALGLIKKNETGFIWDYAGVRGHSICAFWFVVKESGLIKKSIKNNERVTGSIRLFFQIESLAKGTLDQANESSKEFLKLRNDLKKKIADLQQLNLGK